MSRTLVSVLSVLTTTHSATVQLDAVIAAARLLYTAHTNSIQIKAKLLEQFFSRTLQLASGTLEQIFDDEDGMR